MIMQKTNTYQLNQWEPGDAVNREDFNADNAAIDAALGELSTAVESKAEQADLAATNAALGQVATALGSGGKNCRIQWGSYVGTGTYGESNPMSLSFEIMPKVVMISTGDLVINSIYNPYIGTIMLFHPITAADPITGNGLYVYWDNKSVSWYSTTYDKSADVQMNENGRTYCWIALGYDE